MSLMAPAEITIIKIPRVIFPNLVSFIAVFDSVLSRRDRKVIVNVS